MAEIPTLEPASAEAPAASPRRRRKLWPVLIAVIVILGGAGAGAWAYFGRAGNAAATAHDAHAAPKGPPLFVALDPAFVVNFQTPQLVRFLQVNVQVMTHDPKTVDLIKNRNPIVRNDLLLLFSNQKYQDLASVNGKEKLRAQALAAVRRVVAAAGGEPDHVEAVYFTSFVMQ